MYVESETHLFFEKYLSFGFYFQTTFTYKTPLADTPRKKLGPGYIKKKKY